MSRVPLGKGMRVAVVRNGNNDSTTFAELQALIAGKADLSALKFINGVPIDKIINGNGTLNPTVVAQIYQSFLSESRKNRVPDSDIKFQSTYWTLSGLAITAGASPIGGNAFTFTGTGAASGNQSVLSDIVDVTPGETVCLSGYIDATHCTVNAPFWGIYSTDGLTQYAVASGVLGQGQRVSKKWLVPAGVTQVIVVAATNNATVANATKVVFSEAQLESGDQASSYMPNLANDGTGYLKAGAAAIDLSSGIHLNVNQDHVADGATYGRMKNTSLTGNDFDFSKGGVAKILDNIGDGATYGRPLLARLSAGKPWIDFSESIHANKTMDYMGDGTDYVRTAQTTANLSALDIPDPKFQLGSSGTPPKGWDIWTGAPTISYPAAGPSPIYGSQYLQLESTAAEVEEIDTLQHWDCNPDDQVTIYPAIYSYSGDTVGIYAVFLNSSGGGISQLGTNTTAAAWNTTPVTVTAPSGTVAVKLRLYFNATAANHFAMFNRCAVTINDTRVAGSGAQLGDCRNIRGLTAAGVNYYISGSSFTATSTSISVPAQTLIMGGSGTGNVSYNSSSVSGLSPSTTYYLYYIDPGFQGGSQTLHATTSKTTLAGNPDIVFLGYWTTPASGSGGSGGVGGCVSQSAWLYTADGSAVQAKDATKGLILHTMTDANVVGTDPILNDPYLVLQPAVTISTANGSITLSDMTPVNCKAGAFPAYDTLNEEVWTSLNDGSWEQVISVTYVQAILVSRISLGGLSYGAGDQPDYFIFTHNTYKP